MITIKTRYTKSKTVHNNIFVMPQSNKSYAALLLLNEMYSRFDLEKNYDYVKKNYTQFRYDFLKSKMVDGKLTCEYCGRDDLIIHGDKTTKKNRQSINNKCENLATIDHIIPISRNGGKLDRNNCRVSCKDCNNKKADQV